MKCSLSDKKYFLKKLLFLILFFKKDGFAFRYPMNIFFDKKIEEKVILNKWKNYNKSNWSLQLYIHSIFCDTRCNYCDCESLLKVNEWDAILYKKYILEELNKYWNVINKSLDSIYFWWGTFNLFSDDEIIEICWLVHKNFKLSKECRWQVEIHPYYLTDQTLKILKDFWVTDIMLWIQTTSERVNKLNNRKFNLDKLNFAVDSIIKLWFKKVSFDIMYNLPYMTLNDTMIDLDYVYSIWNKIKKSWIDINLEINRWDISLKTWFASIFLKKWGKDKFFDICKYYINNSNKVVKIVDEYIDKKFLWFFDTEREEIEERKYKNTAILWLWLSSTSYIPWVLAYENISYSSWKEFKSLYIWYELSGIDNYLSFISDNLRRGIDKVKFNYVLNNSLKFNEFYSIYKELFREKKEWIFMNINSDLENDILNIYLIDNNISLEQYDVLFKKWLALWFSKDDLEKYTDIFLTYYYNRNKLYG